MKRALCVLLSTYALVACTHPADISSKPVSDVLSSGPIGQTVQQGLLDAEWNLDQAIAVGALPKDDPADACLHQGLTGIGIEPVPPGTPVPTTSTSFTPRESDLISVGAVLYIRAQQAKALGVGGAISLPPACKAIIGGFILDAAAVGKSVIPGSSIIPTIQ